MVKRKKRGNDLIDILPVISIILLIIAGLAIVYFSPQLMLSAPLGPPPQPNIEGLPTGFIPITGYYHDILGGRVVLIDENGLIYSSADGRVFSEVSRQTLYSQGLPLEFTPSLGYYTNLNGNKIVVLYDSNGYAYYSDPLNPNRWINFTLTDKENSGLPRDYQPVTARYSLLLGGIVDLWDESGNQFRRTGSTMWQDITSNVRENYIELPQTAPLFSYYAVFGEAHNYLWYNVNGELKVWQSNPDNSVSLTPVSGLPDGIPEIGYYNSRLNEVIVWYGSDAYRAGNGVDFEKMGSSSECDPNYPNYDLDGDGEITGLDAYLVTSCVLGQEICIEDLRIYADFNCDGQIDALDLQIIINKLSYFSDFEGLPEGFTPIFGYSKPDSVVLYTANGNVYKSTNGVLFAQLSRAQMDNAGLPLAFKPTIGYFQNLSGGSGNGVVVLWNASGYAYYHNIVPDRWIKFDDNDKANVGLPRNFEPVAARFSKLGSKSITLWNASGTIYRRDSVTSNWYNITRNIEIGFPQLPNDRAPLFSYYANLSRENDTNYLWYNFDDELRVWQYNASNNVLINITPQLTGLPNIFYLPTTGYYDVVRKKVIVWYGPIAYQSDDGINFQTIVGYENTEGWCISDFDCDEGQICDIDTALCVDEGTPGGGPPGGGPPGGGAGGGGGITRCYSSWRCGNWSNIAESCGSRVCTDVNRCNTPINRPQLIKVCGDEEEREYCGDEICSEEFEDCEICPEDCGECILPPVLQQNMNIWTILLIVLVASIIIVILSIIGVILYKRIKIKKEMDLTKIAYNPPKK